MMLAELLLLAGRLGAMGVMIAAPAIPKIGHCRATAGMIATAILGLSGGLAIGFVIWGAR